MNLDALPVFREDLPEGYRALVIGAGGTIGQGFHAFLSSDPRCHSVTAIARSSDPDFDLDAPQRFSRVLERVVEAGPFDFVIDATGVLVIDGQGPEKTLKAIDPIQIERYFRINALGPILLLRALEPFFSKGMPVYAKLSARVGSIADNRLGGWYGYRTSKAALNMLLQTAAIELQRFRPKMRVIALQPGTVRSKLSAPFIRPGQDVIAAEVAVMGLMEAIPRVPMGAGATFIDYQGHVVPW